MAPRGDYTIILATIERGREDFLEQFFGVPPVFDRHGVISPIRAGWGEMVQLDKGRYGVYTPGQKVYFQGELFE